MAHLNRRFHIDPSLLLALILAIPALLPLAAPGYFFDAHDAHHSVFWLVEFDQAFRDGAPWPVWAPDHALGFGYPLWLVYAPLAYYAAEVFHLLGLGFVAAVKCAWALGFLVGALGMYRLARRWWGPSAGLIASLAYTYAPYHLVDIYVRAALAEFAALACFPWVLLAFDRLWDDPRPRRAAVAALALGALLLTHSMAPVTFGPLLGGFLLIKLVTGWLRGRRSGVAAQRVSTQGAGPALGRAPALWAGIGLALGLGLAMIFVLPLVLERRYVAETSWLQSTYDYSRNFVFPHQLFSSFWGFGYSVEGPSDGMSFQLGLLPFIGAVVGTLAALRRPYSGVAPGAMGLPRRAEALFLAGSSLVAILAMTSASKPLWDVLPLVGLIQFPWRLLAITTVTLALLAGAAAHWLEPSGRTGPVSLNPFVYVLALVIVLASFPYTRPELLAIRPQDESPLAVIEFEMRHPDMRGMMQWSERPPLDADSPLLSQYLLGLPLRKAAIVAGQGMILEQGHTANSAYARVKADGDVRLRFYTYYFPGWRASVDGRPAELTPEGPNGLIGLALPPGEHDVRLRFGSTAPRTAGALLSGLALVAVAGLLLAGSQGKVTRSV